MTRKLSAAMTEVLHDLAANTEICKRVSSPVWYNAALKIINRQIEGLLARGLIQETGFIREFKDGRFRLHMVKVELTDAGRTWLKDGH